MKYEVELNKLASNIWDYAELKFEEKNSTNDMIEFLKKEGFEIKQNLADIPTAFSASYGEDGGNTIGILAEFDALSGLSQEADVFEPKVRTCTNNGHGCGHHLLGVGSIGAALLVRDYIKENKIKGKVILYGCPGEEGGSGKAFMANAGVFDEIDAAITWHPFNTNAIFTGSLLANKQVYVRFHGKSSHAAFVPNLGRSALDALELTNVGVNFLREHIEDGDRIHYAITDAGGISPNVVQNFAEGIYLIRSSNSEKVDKLYERFEKIVQGAALMTETKGEIIFDKSCSEIITNKALEEALYESFKKLGVPTYTDEELAYAKKFRDNFTVEDIRSEFVLKLQEDPEQLFEVLNSKVMADFLVDYRHVSKTMPGSSDVGDVSAVVPTAQIMTACYAVGTPGHSWQEVAQGKSSIAFKGMHKASEVMSDTVIRLLQDNELLDRATEEFKQKTKNRKPSSMPKGARPLALQNK